MPHLVIRPVEGLMLPDPRGSGRIFGHESFADESEQSFSIRTGKNEPGRKWKFVPGDVVVAETNDGYLRQAILHGDVEYVSHCESQEPHKHTHRDPELLRASVKHSKLRAAAKEASELAALQAADDLKAEVEAAAEGLTVEEFKAQKGGK